MFTTGTPLGLAKAQLPQAEYFLEGFIFKSGLLRYNPYSHSEKAGEEGHLAWGGDSVGHLTKGAGGS